MHTIRATYSDRNGLKVLKLKEQQNQNMIYSYTQVFARECNKKPP